MTLSEIPVLLINLPERKDRLGQAMKELDGLNYGIVNGVRSEKPMLGIAQAHLNCILIAKQNEWDHVLIIEDDIQLRKGYQGYLTEALKGVPESWDILLGGIYEGKTKKVNPYWSQVGEFCGLHFYIVNSKAYDIILSYDSKQHIDRWMNMKGRLNCYVLNKFIATQRDGFSDNVKKSVDYSDKIKKYQLL